MLSSVPHTDTIIIADLEAGIGTLTRLPEGAVEHTLVVVEPTPRSIDVGMRAVQVATECRQGRVTVVANKVSEIDDETRVRAAFADHDVVAVPADEVVTKADRDGVSPLDLAADAPAVVALVNIATRIAEF